VTFKVAKESHPVITPVSVAVCVSVVVKFNPFHVKGISVSHTVVSVVLNKVGFTVTFKVAKESHPVITPVSVAVCEPAAAKFNPFHVKGSSVSHTVVSVVLRSVGFTVTFKVTIESHPVTTLARVVV
jgi:predicted homoserine dehydrogenase-like protein